MMTKKRKTSHDQNSFASMEAAELAGSLDCLNLSGQSSSVHSDPFEDRDILAREDKWSSSQVDIVDESNRQAKSSPATVKLPVKPISPMASNILPLAHESPSDQSEDDLQDLSSSVSTSGSDRSSSSSGAPNSSAPNIVPPNTQSLGLQNSTSSLSEHETLDPNLIHDYRNALLNSNVEVQAETLLNLRRKLTDPDSSQAMIGQVFETDVPQILLEKFAIHSDWKMQFNALICLKELSANPRPGIHAMAIIRTMLDLLDTSNIIEVIEVALVILGHMSQDAQPLRSKYMRHAILNHNVLNRITSILTDSNAHKLIPAVAWLSSTLIEDPMPANLDSILGDEFILMLVDFVLHGDDDTVANSLSALSGIVETYPASWNLIVCHTGSNLSKLLDILDDGDQRIVFSALKIFATVTSTEDDEIMQLLMENGLLGKLKNLIHHPTSTIRLWVAFGLSNILTGFATQVKQVIDIGIIPPLVSMIEYDLALKASGSPEYEPQIILNAACALANGLGNTSEDKQVYYFLDQRVIETIVKSLDASLPEYVIDCIISALMHVMIDGEPLSVVAICLQMERCNAPEKLRTLIHDQHQNPEIVQNLNEILIAMNTIKFNIKK